MTQVHINGVTMLPGIDYTSGPGTLMFSVPPGAGSEIIFTQLLSADTGATYMHRLIGDGKTYMFSVNTGMADRVKISRMIDCAIQNRRHPAVEEALTKLQVVLELLDDRSSN